MWGCSTNPPIHSTTFVESVKLGEKANRLNSATETISKHTQKPEVLNETAKIDAVATELRDDDKRVIALQEQVITLQNDNKSIKEEYQSAVAKSRQAMYATATWVGGILALVGLVCLVASIKIPFVGGLGAGFSLLGIVIVSIVQFLSTYDWASIAIGLVSVFCIVGWGGYSLYKNFKSNKAKELAVVDLAKTVEFMKPKLKDGWDDIKKTVSQLHAPSTQDIIAQVKKTQINNQYEKERQR
jgi:membrane-bound ClpP family serine protease